jgi:hypothetical protein
MEADLQCHVKMARIGHQFLQKSNKQPTNPDKLGGIP